MHPQLGASFQSYIMAKFYVSIATAVFEKSKLWKPTKIWAVSTISTMLSDCFGDQPDKFSVCIFFIYAAIYEPSKAS
jgi:hypothetical protein